MAEDSQFDTGEYSPARYWDERVRQGHSIDMTAVGVLSRTAVENECMHRVQRACLERFLKPLVTAGLDVLEFGCGVGRWHSLLKSMGARWTGVDASREMVVRLRRLHPDATARTLEDPGRLPFADDVFDLVYTVTVLHHNDYPEQEVILSEITRVLRPSGHLLILEDMGRPGPHNAFNYFPRPRGAWIDLLASHHIRPERLGGVRYWILKDGLRSLLRRLGRKASIGPALERALDRLDRLVDPYLYPLVPAGHQLGLVVLGQSEES